MIDPVEIEQEFEELQNSLALTSSIRSQLLMIQNFISGYQEQPLLYESYVHQLSQQIPVIDHPLSIAGTDPEVLEQIYTNLRNLQNDYPIVSEIESYRNSLVNIKCYVSFLYALVGKFQKAVEVLGIDHPGPIERVKNKTEWYQYLSDLNPKLKTEINLIQSIFDKALEKKGHTVYVPVIEKRLGYQLAKSIPVSRLRRLSVTLEKISKKQDDIQLNIATFGPEKIYSEYLVKPLNAVRQLLKDKTSRINNHHYHGHLSFQLMNSMHEGFSASLAIAGLLYEGMLEASQERVYYILNNRMGITGDISEDGRVIPVDEQTLAAKVHACFFSWLDIMVVPKEQLNEAELKKARLLQRYPDKKLTILGVEHLEDLFYDRRISEEVRLGRIKQVGHAVRKYKFNITVLAIMMILSGMVVLLAQKPFDKNPAIAVYKGETMFVENKEGQPLWKIKAWDQAGAWAKMRLPLKANIIYDVNGDGVNDIIHIKQLISYAFRNQIVCYDGASHKILWKLNFKKDLSYPYKPFIGDDFYFCAGMLLDTMSTGEPSLYVIENHTKYFPGFLLRINPRNGKITDTFVNAGHLNGIGLLDINHNGKREVVVTGVNNGYKQAIIGILPHDHFDGKSPSTKAYALNGYSVDPKLGYIRIPKTYLAKSLENITTFNVGRFIIKNKSGLIVKVNDARPVYEDSLIGGTLVLYQFNKTMQLTNIGTNDDYDHLSGLLQSQGKIKKLPGPAYFIHFRDSLLYWNGHGWQHKPWLPFWEKGEGKHLADSKK